MNPRQEQDYRQAKKEGVDDANHYKFPKNNIITSSSSRQFSSFKNPRIVRVSRTCGGKDRHSKVCTVKGLRDRRIRLSVPTAIQLYDLQERLGLSQPSKVVDWLIEATKNEIDKLPPLPNFPQFHPQESSSSSLPDFPNNQDLGIKMNEQNFFPLNHQSSSIPNMPYNSNNYLINWDHSHHPNLSLSQFGGGYNSFSFSSQTDVFPASMPSFFPPFSSQIMENINENFQQNSILPTTLHLKSFTLDEISSKNVHSLDKDKRN
ncbi:hypothetical protein CDL12_19807 [Handroanthus impetiginosus]|uniref:TCP domain-containing protein n=1 Tax=Handroanthus impetiginosus TaxID=429701 RepID=A0A2G9GQR8_9LAMI|nr:hypothetical protein CDL12_19807 [Handroanthus impetiginosus]